MPSRTLSRIDVLVLRTLWERREERVDARLMTAEEVFDLVGFKPGVRLDGPTLLAIQRSLRKLAEDRRVTKKRTGPRGTEGRPPLAYRINDKFTVISRATAELILRLFHKSPSAMVLEDPFISESVKDFEVLEPGQSEADLRSKIASDAAKRFITREKFEIADPVQYRLIVVEEEVDSEIDYLESIRLAKTKR